MSDLNSSCCLHFYKSTCYKHSDVSQIEAFDHARIRLYFSDNLLGDVHWRHR